MSSYPYLVRSNPADLRPDHFSAVRSLAPNKPFAVAETGFIAEDLAFSNGTRVPGTPAWQNAYLTRLLKESNGMQAEFVVWFVWRDYDILFTKIEAFTAANPAFAPFREMFRVFRDAGLLDGEGRPRPALATWDGRYRRPRQR